MYLSHALNSYCILLAPHTLGEEALIESPPGAALFAMGRLNCWGIDIEQTFTVEPNFFPPPPVGFEQHGKSLVLFFAVCHSLKVGGYWS